MRAIGGYFELELNNFKSIYHNGAIAVNSGRNAFELILQTIKPGKIYIPYYTCDVVLQPIKKLNIDFDFYYLDHELQPIIESYKKDDYLLYVNYFGLLDSKLSKLLTQFNNIIIDNSQAFYTQPIDELPTFYSPRKFFGLPDGGFAYIKDASLSGIKKSESLERFSHLILRIDKGAEEGYSVFKENDASLNNSPLKGMSALTNALMRNINYEEVKAKRLKNFNYLHEELQVENEFTPLIENSEYSCPMVYPFLKNGNISLRQHLIKEKIYIATYWPNVLEWLNNAKNFEYYLTNNLLPLPIDQRYSEDELKRVITVLKEIL